MVLINTNHSVSMLCFTIVLTNSSSLKEIVQRTVLNLNVIGGLRHGVLQLRTGVSVNVPTA